MELRLRIAAFSKPAADSVPCPATSTAVRKNLNHRQETLRSDRHHATQSVAQRCQCVLSVQRRRNGPALIMARVGGARMRVHRHALAIPFVNLSTSLGASHVTGPVQITRRGDSGSCGRFAPCRPLHYLSWPECGQRPCTAKWEAAWFVFQTSGGGKGIAERYLFVEGPL